MMRGKKTEAAAAMGGAVLVALSLAACSATEEGTQGKASRTTTTTSSQTAPTSKPAAVPSQMATPGFEPTPVATPLPPDTPPSKVFDPKLNVFRVDVSKAPVHPSSAAMIKNLKAQITPHWGGVAAFNNDQYNPSYYVVKANTPRVDLGFYDCQKKGSVPPGLMDGPAMFKQVPIPADAIPATGTDSTLTIYSPDTDQLWEFWVLRKAPKDPTKWQACWGGRIDNVSTTPGYFDAPYGASASGLVTTGSMITVKEAAAGKIDHAMALNLIETGHHSRVWYPANRSDGNSSNPNAIPEGARLRLDPSVNVDALQIPLLSKAIARAAQKHGFIVVDTAHAVAVIAEGGNQERAETGKNPWDAILAGTPNYELLKGFPWDKMQVIQKDFGKPTS